MRRRALLAVALLAAPLSAQGPTTEADVPPGKPGTSYVDPAKAYLFAHMMVGHYGVLYYSVSRDGLHWTFLNGGRPIPSDYHGHASIARGADGAWYLVGNKGDDDPLIRFWRSTDLVTWTPFGTYQPDLMHVTGHPHALQRIGAPKLFYDAPSQRFLLTWHTPNRDGDASDPERYWASQRTLYVLSPDLKRFDAVPKRLLAWDMATIDTIVRPREDGRGYCAILKDERYPSYDWTTGKTVRISCGATLTGPFPLPGPSLSPNFREAPTVIRAPDGKSWLLYYEQYAGTSYGLSRGRTLAGPWFQVSGNSGVPEWNRYEMTPGARHGSMVEIGAADYDRLVAAYPPAG